MNTTSVENQTFHRNESISCCFNQRIINCLLDLCALFKILFIFSSPGHSLPNELFISLVICLLSWLSFNYLNFLMQHCSGGSLGRKKWDLYNKVASGQQGPKSKKLSDCLKNFCLRISNRNAFIFSMQYRCDMLSQICKNKTHRIYVT